MTTPESPSLQPIPEDSETLHSEVEAELVPNQEVEQSPQTYLEKYAASLGAVDSPASAAIKAEIFANSEQPSPVDIQRYHQALSEGADRLRGTAQTRAQIGVGIAVADLYDGVEMDQQRDEMLNDMRDYASHMGFADIVDTLDDL